MSYACSTVDAVDKVDEGVWIQVCPVDNDPLMDLRFLRAVENSAAADERFWYATVTDDNGLPLACAVFSRITIDAGLFGRLPFKTYLRIVRTFFPRHMQLTALMCGVPVSTGGSHLRIADSANRAEVIRCLAAEMDNLAAGQRATLVTWKEFGEGELSYVDELTKLGYLRADSVPMNCFEHPFGGPSDYYAALRSHYRYKLNRSRKKFHGAGLRLEHITDTETILRLYTGEVHALYEEVASRAKDRLEILPHAFFQQLAQELPAETVLTAIFQGDRIVAFAWGLTRGDVYRDLFIGFEQAMNDEADLYFNLMTFDLEYGLGQPVSRIHVGQTADDFKARLGCSSQPRYFYVRLASRFLDRCMRTFAGRLFPPHCPPPPRQIFRDSASGPAGVAVGRKGPSRGPCQPGDPCREGIGN